MGLVGCRVHSQNDLAGNAEIIGGSVHRNLYPPGGGLVEACLTPVRLSRRGFMYPPKRGSQTAVRVLLQSPPGPPWRGPLMSSVLFPSERRRSAMTKLNLDLRVLCGVNVVNRDVVSADLKRTGFGLAANPQAPALRSLPRQSSQAYPGIDHAPGWPCLALEPRFAAGQPARAGRPGGLSGSPGGRGPASSARPAVLSGRRMSVWASPVMPRVRSTCTAVELRLG